MSQQLLYDLFVTTLDWNLFHEISRKIILVCEIPAIEILFKPHRVHIRHSVQSAQYFNLFASDIDLSATAPTETELQKAFAVHQKLKKKFINLGEIELYLTAEWALKEKLLSSPFFPFWQKTYYLRKFNWQSQSLRDSSNAYQRSKHERGLAITLERLGASKLPISGDKLFDLADLDSKDKFSFSTSFHSKFLESSVGLLNSEAKLVFSTPEKIEAFRRCLPDSSVAIDDPQSKQIKTFLMTCEYLQTHITRRQHLLLNRKDQLGTMDHWLATLRSRGCPSLSEALKKDF
jgi:hypothetical protein